VPFSLVALLARRARQTKEKDMSATWNVIGLVLSLVWVLLLFMYGMPYRIRSGGAEYLISEQTDQNEKDLDSKYDKMGWVGLGAIIFGTIFQIIGAVT
jgi:hypothetical protein